MAIDVFPIPQSTIRRSPFHQGTLEAGCDGYGVYSYTISDVCYYPANVMDPVEEYWKLVKDAILFDPPVERPIEIRGPQASELVDRLVTRDLSTCRVGQCKYVVLCDDKGGLLPDSVLIRLDSDRYWLSGDLGWIKGLGIGWGLAADVFQSNASPVQVQGPRSKDVMHSMFGDTVSGLKFYNWVEVTFQGLPLIVTRTGWTGEHGYEIYLSDQERGLELWNAILDAGKPYGLVAGGTSMARRVEAGILAMGEYCLEHNPYEVGLGRWVDLDKKSPFVGREALRYIHNKGITRKLVGYTSPEEIVPANYNMTHELEFPFPVRVGANVVGTVTVAVWSPSLEKTIGFAMVPIELSEIGSSLTADTPDGPVEIEVTSVPFVDPGKLRMKGA